MLFLIKWKFVEQYRYDKTKKDGSPGKTRSGRYQTLIEDANSPFSFAGKLLDEEFWEWFYTEPYYQLMRQTLLGWQMSRGPENNGNATDFYHIHVIPEKNLQLREASKACLGHAKHSLSETWKNCLKRPERYFCVDPADLLKPLENTPNYGELYSYLQKRYWQDS